MGFTVSVYKLVAAAYFLHEGILSLLNALKMNPRNEYSSLKDDMVNLYGNINSATSNSNGSQPVWPLFGQAFNGLVSSPVLPLNFSSNTNNTNTVDSILQIGVSAYTQDNWKGADDFDSMTSLFCSLSFSCQNEGADIGTSPAPTNSIITSLKFSQVGGPPNFNSSNYDYLDAKAWMLQCQIATVGPNLELQPIEGYFPDKNNQQVTAGWNGSIHDSTTSGSRWRYDGSTQLLLDGQGNLPSCLSTTFITPPQSSNTSIIKVATGFKIAMVGNRLAIALQYGDLDVSDLSNPTVVVNDKTYYTPAWYTDGGNTDKYTWRELPDFIDKRPSGNSEIDLATSQAMNIPGFITNVALNTAQRGPLTSLDNNDNNLAIHNRMYIIQQMASSLYNAPWLQPDALCNQNTSAASN